MIGLQNYQLTFTKYFLSPIPSLIFSVLMLGQLPSVSIAVSALRDPYLHPSYQDEDSIIYKSDQLIIRRLSTHVYQHISFLKTKDFGNVSCNGMIVQDGGEALVFDTPATDSSSEELIKFAAQQHWKIKAVIPTHFHADCIAGLDNFRQHDINCYAFARTIKILKEKKNEVFTRLKKFDSSITFTVGSKKVFAGFFGEGHTVDNIIGYYADDKVLFGGCLIKEVGAGKGNLEDANVNDWARTVLKVKENFPDARLVIPGHGKTGGRDLFDYTIQLFK